jgi:cell fate regulator YaaT (PSP1 superfamily)
MDDFKLNNGERGLCCRGCGRQNSQLNTFDWLADIPGNTELCDLVEVQFKNTRKGYYRNSNHLELNKGDIVAVEATPGHDIGTVTLMGKLVPLQLKKSGIKQGTEIKRIYRKARPVDMEKFEEAKAKEHDTMIRSRQIAKSLGLEMKIGDVEYQGDGNKAIFYYIADGRVDFRQLIKVLADAFHVRIEMKQIGARQEAGRIGGIGPCGRELCCATWMKNFVSVSTTAARFQDISLNPQKLAGQCAKLKCCLNYEVDSYVEAAGRIPAKDVTLHTMAGEYFLFKTDILSGMLTYSTDKNLAANLVTIPARHAFRIISMNKRGEKPESLEENPTREVPVSTDLLDQDSLTRFDKHRKKKKKGNNDDRRKERAKVAAEGAAGEKPSGEKPNRGEGRPERRNEERRNKGERNKPRNNGENRNAENGNNGENRKSNNRNERNRNNRRNNENKREASKTNNANNQDA